MAKKLKLLTREKIDFFFQSDRAVLLLCMGIALLFWLLVKLSQDFKTTFSIPISYQLAEDKTFMIVPPSSIDATVVGSGWSLMTASFSPTPRLVLEISEVEEMMKGSSWLEAKIRDKLPVEMEVQDVSPEFIRIQLADKVVKNIPLNLKANISFANGYHALYPPSISLDSVSIAGPKPIVDSIFSWSNVPFTLKDVKKDTDLELNLNTPANEAIRIEPLTVDFTLKVEALTEKTMFIPITIENEPDSVQIIPKSVRLSCLVGISQYEAISRDSFVVKVDLGQINTPSINNTVPIILSQKHSKASQVSFYPNSVEYFFLGQ